MPFNPPREKDNEVLSWMRQRFQGISAYQIAKEAGVNSGRVVNATNKAKAADQAHDPADYQPGKYWQ